MIERVCVVGTGAWGTVLAALCVRGGLQTTLLCRTASEAAELASSRENRRFLPGVSLPAALTITADARAALTGAQLAVLAVPAQRLRHNLAWTAPSLPDEMHLLCASKGIELETGLRMSRVIAQVLGPRTGVTLSLSGPTLSGEIARGLPAAAVIAGDGESGEITRAVQAALSSERLRLYTSADQVGVELGGAMKNVVAIACGICDGLGYGHNARAGLITRGLAEMTRLACACGGAAATIAGLAGLGDLVTTVAGASSRNYALGLALGEGARLADLIDMSSHIAEGVPTTRAALVLAAHAGVQLPITEQLAAVLQGAITPRQGGETLMRRELGSE